MNIVLFAIIGVTIEAGVAYWICFAVHCLLWLIGFSVNIIKESRW